MKKSSNQIIAVIIAFLVGILVSFAFDRDKEPNDVMEDSTAIEEAGEAGEVIEGTNEVAAPGATTTTAKPVAAAPKVPASNSNYSAGTCVPSLNGKKDSTYSAILLNWTPCSNLTEFQFYKLVRSEKNPAPTYPGDYEAFSSSNKDAANYIDKTVTRASTYNYRLCVVQRLGKTSCSNTVTVSY